MTRITAVTNARNLSTSRLRCRSNLRMDDSHAPLAQPRENQENAREREITTVPDGRRPRLRVMTIQPLPAIGQASVATPTARISVADHPTTRDRRAARRSAWTSGGSPPGRRGVLTGRPRYRLIPPSSTPSDPAKAASISPAFNDGCAGAEVRHVNARRRPLWPANIHVTAHPITAAGATTRSSALADTNPKFRYRLF